METTLMGLCRVYIGICLGFILGYMRMLGSYWDNGK